MDCERARDDMVERLTGTLDSGRSKALDEHLAGCSACSAEAERLHGLWTELGTLRVPPPTGAAGRVSRLVAARGTGAAETVGPVRARAPRVALTGLALAASLLVGVVVGGRVARPSATAASAVPNAGPATPKERYVLLLHGPARDADVVGEQAIVAEYRAWAMKLRDSGALVTAEKLADEPVTLLTANNRTELPHNTAEELGGFFLIQVADSAEAFRIARECPHLRHGGAVQVRRIQPT
jgi:hypothetical protein